MAITTFDGFVASAKQSVGLFKSASRTAIAAAWFSTFDLAGNPGAGALAGTSTTAGVVPTDATAGCPIINAISATGYLAQVDFGNTVASRMRVCDMVFKAGGYSFNSNVALSSQPSYSGRMPGGSYAETQLWVEAITAFTGNPTFTITYTNQAGTTGKVATLAAGLAPTVGRMLQIPLASGDTGIQKIENVQCSVATVGTFNVLVLRQIWGGRVRINNDGAIHNLNDTAMRVLYSDSALILMVCPDSTATGIPELELVIADG